MKAQSVFENLDFEREGIPYERLGIGDKKIQAINRLDKLAEKYGFRKSPFGSEHEEKGIVNIERWEHPEEDADDPIEVVLYKEEGSDRLDIFFTTYYGGSGNDSVEQWLNEETWGRYYGEEENELEFDDEDVEDKEYY